MPLYFAYGSNMSGRALARLGVTARPRSSARLEGYRLTFFLEDPVWQGGGVAAVVPAPGEHVEGALLELDEDALAALDRYEDVEGGDYRRERRRLRASGGEELEAWVYVPARAAEPYVAPSPAYLACLLEGARERGLSAEWIARLAAAAAS